ncbi:MAG: hypothetical protein ACPGYT_06900 [Nitrospirales bacterium]
MDESAWQEATLLFELSDDYDIQSLRARYQKLLYTWHPARYASLTNNPRKYMEMYKKGEAKTKEIHASYKVLFERLEQ